MRTNSLLASLLLLPFLSCSVEHGRVPSAETRAPLPVGDLAAAAGPDLLDFGILQKTCALYVAVRSSAWNGPLAFGREIDDSMVHWNLCPGGTKVACKVIETADGDTIITGIPWPYAERASN
jgi:hypothetical protein